MRSAAQIGERALAVKGNLLSLGQILNQLHLVIFVEFAHERDRLVARERKPLDGKIALYDFFHLRLHLGEVLHGDGRFKVHVVIIAVVDDGTDGKLTGGINRFQRLRQHVRASMAVNLKPLGILRRYDFECVALR